MVGLQAQSNDKQRTTAAMVCESCKLLDKAHGKARAYATQQGHGKIPDIRGPFYGRLLPMERMDFFNPRMHTSWGWSGNKLAAHPCALFVSTLLKARVVGKGSRAALVAGTLTVVAAERSVWLPSPR